MKIKCVFVLLILVLSMTCTALGAEEKLTIRNADGSERIRDETPTKSISLEDAISQNKDFEDSGILSNDDDDDENEESEESYGYENVDNEDFIRNEVAAGNEQFLVDIVKGLFSGIGKSKQDDENEISNAYKVLTLTPRPYEDKNIVELYGGYLNFALYLIVLFILGESISRSIYRMDITSSSKYRLPRRKFLGGIALSMLAILSNILFKFVLDIIETFNGFIIAPVIPAITPDPGNILIFLVLGLCELLVCIFFIARFYMINVFAVVCSIVVVLLVPKTTREFSKNVLEKMARILVMQPAALFVMSICVMKMDELPTLSGYIGLIVMMYLTCHYCMFGNFTLLKTAISIAIRKGIAKKRV